MRPAHAGGLHVGRHGKGVHSFDPWLPVKNAERSSPGTAESPFIGVSDAWLPGRARFEAEPDMGLAQGSFRWIVRG